MMGAVALYKIRSHSHLVISRAREHVIYATFKFSVCNSFRI